MTHRRNASKRRRPLTLSRYVLARNGVPLGSSGSLQNMLRRSLGAATFAGFWRFWNPIWGYYLGKYVYQPSNRILPRPLAFVLTFLVSGVIHDLVTTVVRGSPTALFTPWFFVMSLGVLGGEMMSMDLSARPRGVRAVANLAFMGACLWIALRFWI